ncbi:sulfite exporter TauE/SafE family protein [Sphingomonas sp. KC8]|uniref:sulfite exporter TauE/SafE family protein n=1 Tax=Sphingomonas sp. KC8 TaxID=1030157 RepID=UPI0002FF664A|nr:sulfite exporter TauE/SafE family protein [Sphingomonas sp. KC8]ARS27916.1 membrane protein [Sphingomonas sp. KC8]
MDVSSLAVMAAAMLATGLAGGVIAGLLGVGGGIIVVPILDTTLGILGVDPAIRMHVAVATSLATIIPTSISSSRAHKAKGAVDGELTRKWGIAILLGAVLGTVVASQVQSVVLSGVFATVAFLVAAKMLLPLDHIALAKAVPGGLAAQAMPVAIGTTSTMMGIGGGTLSVPILTLVNYPIHRAVGTAALFGLLISIPGTIGYIIGGWGDPRLPMGSLGYVNWIGFLLIAPMTWISAPWGAALAHKLSKRHLGIAFGIFLLIVALRMAWRVATS